MSHARSAGAIFALLISFSASAADAKLRAGSAVVDIAPEKFPVLVNGMFEERKAERVLSPLTARAIVLEAARTRSQSWWSIRACCRAI